MKKISILLVGMAVCFLIITAFGEAADIIGKWELVRLEYADGKPKPYTGPPKSKMGGAEFFPDKTVVFSDGMKGEWTLAADGKLKVVLMGVVDMDGTFQGDLLKLRTEVGPEQVLVLKKLK